MYSWRVPITAAGNLEIVPYFDLPDPNDREGESVFYTWRWHYSAPALALWVILALAIVAVKANRNWRALLVLLPLLGYCLLWRGFIEAVGIPSSVGDMFTMIF